MRMITAYASHQSFRVESGRMMWRGSGDDDFKLSVDDLSLGSANFERERASLTLWGSWRVTCFVSGLGGGAAAEGAGAM